MLSFEFLSRFTAVLILALLFAGKSNAQLFPVQASIQIAPPYSPYLSDYTVPGAQKLMVQLVSNDITISDHPIKFRLAIEGLGITIRTKPAFIPTSHTLTGGGAPMLLYGEDLIEYFNPNNLDFAGISRRDFEKSGKLPEGVYRFMLEVVDYHRNVVLSNKALTVAWIVLNDPPLLNFPRNHAKVSIIDPTNIAFAWTPRHTGSPNAAFSTEYIFKLVEIQTQDVSSKIQDAGASNQQRSTINQTINQTLANQAILSQPPIFETTLTQSQFVYGPAEPALLPGRKFAWQVQARDEEGRDIFKNQGKSEVFVFQFGDLIGVPENLRFEGGNDVTLTIRWEPAINGEMPDTYNIRYRQVSTDSWFEMLSGEQRFATIANLKPNTEYDVQVRAKKDKTYSEYTPPIRIKTKEKKDLDFSCGTPPVISAPKNLPALAKLLPGDVITSDDWRVVVTEVTKAENGIFEGKGLMSVKMFNGASIKVTFSGGIDSSYEMLIGGRIKSVYNRGSAMSTVADEMQKIGERRKEALKAISDTLVAPIPIVVIGTIDSVYFDNDKKEIVVIDADGKKATYAQPVNAATKAPMPAQLTDAAGNTVVVAKDGKVTRGASVANGKSNVALVKTDPIKSKIIKLILAQFKSEISTWLSTNGKGGEEDEEIKRTSGLPTCFNKESGQLSFIQEKTIPYYNEHTGELQAKIETKAEDKTIFDQIASLFKDQDAVIWENVTSENKEKSRDAICRAIMEDIAPLAEYYEALTTTQVDELQGAIRKIKSIYTFLKNCNSEGWASYREDGIVPYCFWRDQQVQTGAYYSNVDVPFLSGLVDGTYSEAKGIYHMPELVGDLSKLPSKVVYAYTKAFYDCEVGKTLEKVDQYEYVMHQIAMHEKEEGLINWIKNSVDELIHDYKGQNDELIQYFKDCNEAEHIRETVDELYNLISNWEEIKTLYAQVSTKLSTYWNTVSASDNVGRYEQGALVVPITSTVLTLGLTKVTNIDKVKVTLRNIKEASSENWKKITDKFKSTFAKSGTKASIKTLKNVPFDDFTRTFSATEEQYRIAYELWGEDKWEELFTYFKNNDLNNWNGINWPPFNGAKSITNKIKGKELSGRIFDRFQTGTNAEELGGKFASPVLSSTEGVNDLVFTYDARALADRIQEGTYYFKFRLKDNLPESIEFEYAETIPWFKLIGNADQIKSNLNFGELKENIEIIEILKFERGKWKKIK